MRTSLGVNALLLSSVLASSLAFAQSPLTPAQRPCGGGSVCQVTDNSAEPKVNLVNLSVKVEQVINNDTMVVKLYHEAEGAAAADPYSRNSEALDKVFKRVEKLSTIKVSSGNRRSTPIYADVGVEQGRSAPGSVFPGSSVSAKLPAIKPPVIIGWRERAEITLQSQNFELLSQVMTDLSGDMQMDSMSFKVSDQARKAQEGVMLSKAMDEFREKAQQTSSAFNASSYGLVNISLGEVMPSYENQVGAMPMMAYKSSRSPAPEISSGESKFSLTANGTIQLFEEGR